ncbi:MAG: hypothetical protein JNM85_08320 [Chthonomonas sp.]|nr:hypothetical protein [Chthonomonas sp.]
MKKLLLMLTIAAIGLVAAGCGSKDEAAEAATKNTAPEGSAAASAQPAGDAVRENKVGRN